MKLKYYDILSQVIVGYFVLFASLYAIGISYDTTYSLPYLLGAYLIGYFVNIISICWRMCTTLRLVGSRQTGCFVQINIQELGKSSFIRH